MPIGTARAGVMGGGSAIPDSEANQKLIHRWVLDDVNGTVADAIGGADGTNNGITSVDGNYAGGSAGEGDGSSHIETTTLGDFGSNMDSDFAIAYSVTTTASDAGAVTEIIDSTNNEELWLGTPVSDTAIFNLRDDDGNRGRITSDSTVSDGGKYRVVCNKPSNDVADWEIWINQSEDGVTIANDTWSSNPSVYDFADPVPLFARNIRDSIDSQFNGVIDDICIFGSSLTQSEIESYANPWE